MGDELIDAYGAASQALVAAYEMGTAQQMLNAERELPRARAALANYIALLRAALEKADALLAIQDHPTLARGEGAALAAYRDARGKVE